MTLKLNRSTLTKCQDSLNLSLFGGYKRILIVAALLWPILLSYSLYPDTFLSAWNEGRGGFLIAAVLISVDLLVSRSVVLRNETRLIVIPVFLVSLYYCGLSGGASYVLTDIGRSVGVLANWSWIQMWDYAILGAYFAACLALTIRRTFRIWIGGAATLYLLGYVVILFLDAFFPYDTLGFLQYFVPFYLALNEGILYHVSYALGLETQFTSQSIDNMLILQTLDGPFVMKVYWPSAGIHSIIIFSVTMLALLPRTRTSISPKRMVIYFLIGIIGTIVINIVRLILLSFYAINMSSALLDWDQFHSIAGELIFVPWMIFYIMFVLHTEEKHRKQIGNIEWPQLP